MPTAFRSATLDNGLTVIAETDPGAHSAAVGFFVRTGARDEATPLMGVSHFLEHMMFKGTDDMSADEINRRLDELGGRSNAYTSNEMTCFYTHVLPEFLTEATGLIGRMMRPALRQSDFDTEKGVILEEIAMYKDNPFWVLYEETVARHYGAHPMSHRVLGTPESITAMTRDAMEGYFNNRYSADNTVVAFAGRLDFDAAVAQARALCGTWQRTGARRDSGAPSVGGGRFEMRDEKVNRAYMLGLAPGPGIEDERRYAAALLSQVLGAADNSRLHWALIETGLAEEAQASYDSHDGLGEFFVFASGDPDRTEEIWSVVEREIRGLLDSLVEDDLVRLRGKLATAVTIGAERPADRMQRIGRYWTYMHQYRTLDEELDRINRVTLKDLREVGEAFPMTPVTVGRRLPA